VIDYLIFFGYCSNISTQRHLLLTDIFGSETSTIKRHQQLKVLQLLILFRASKTTSIDS